MKYLCPPIRRSYFLTRSEPSLRSGRLANRFSRLPGVCHAPSRTRRAVFVAERLEDRVNPVSFAAGDSSGVGSNAMSIAFGEINGDGAIDMAVGTASSGVEIFINDGTGDFTRTSTVTGTGFPEQMELADFNGDGFADIVTGLSFAHRVAVVMNNGDGTFGGPILKDIGVSVQDVCPADFNGDGKLDVVAAIPGGAAVLFNTGAAGVLGTPTLYNHDSSGGAAWVAVGDFNGDARPDFAVSVHLLRRVDVYLNDGTGGFTRTQYANPVANDSGDILTGDFTNDGHLDILFNYYLTGMVGLLAGNGDGTFQAATVINTSAPRTAPLAAADFDRDGNLDFLTMQESGQDDLVLLGNGDGTFESAVPIGAAYPGDVAVADVNGDGLPDIGTSQGLSPGTVNLTINTTPVDLYLVVAAPVSATAGDSFSVTVTARGPTGAVLTDYDGTIHFSSTDAQAELPADYQYTPGDNGAKTFTVTLKTVGDRSIVITDLDNAPAYGLDVVSVRPAAASSFEVNAPSDAAVGKPFGITVAARDAFGNIAVGYTGTVHFTSTDPDAVLPTDRIVTLGLGNAQVTLKTEGTWTITAGDASAGITGDSAPITVTRIPVPPIVADFGARGLRRWTEAGGWVVLSRLNAERIVESADHEVVVADFGTYGLRRWTEADGWTVLSRADVGKVAVSGDGEAVAASFGAGILKRWTETGGWVKLSSIVVQQSFLSSDGATVVADFGTHGLRRWTEAGGWTVMDTANPGAMAVSADCSSMAVNFSFGLWYWTESGGWSEATLWNTERLALSADGMTVIASFKQNGLWRWTKSGGWFALSPLHPENLSVSSDGQTLAADFGKLGVKVWFSDAGWFVFSSANVQNVLLSQDAQILIADFGAGGLRGLGSDGWVKLSAFDPEQMLLG